MAVLNAEKSKSIFLVFDRNNKNGISYQKSALQTLYPPYAVRQKRKFVP